MSEHRRPASGGRGGSGRITAAARKRAGAILRAAAGRGERTLSEHDSKQVLSAYGVKFNHEALVTSLAAARTAARRIGFPVVLKVCGAEHSHKSEKGLVAVGLGSQREVADAYRQLSDRVGPGHRGAFLVQEMVSGRREVMLGMHRDPAFGPSVLFGLGGIFAEVLDDVVFRIAPLGKRDAAEMMRGILAHQILGSVRGLPPVDREALGRALIAVGALALDHDIVSEIDINPVIIRGREPVAVDALVALAPSRA